MRDSTTHRRTATTHTGRASNARTRRSFKLALVAQAAAALILAACGGGGDDALTPAGGKLDANGSQQQGNTNRKIVTIFTTGKTRHTRVPCPLIK